MFSVDVIF